MGKAKAYKPSVMDQPLLIELSNLPEQPELVAEAKSYAHTGSTVLKNGERCEEIITDLISGMSLRAVCRKHHVHPDSVGQIREALEQSGKLETLKAKLSRGLGVLAAVSCETATEMVIDGTMPAQCVPVTMGIALQRKEELDNVLVPERKVDANFSAASVLQRLEKLSRLAGQAVPKALSDGQSEVLEAKAQ